MDGALATDRMLSRSGRCCTKTHGGKSRHQMLRDPRDAVGCSGTPGMLRDATGSQGCRGLPRMLWDGQNPRVAVG